MASVAQLIDFKNPVFSAYAFWSTVLAIKLMYLSVHTAIFRFKNQVRFNLPAYKILLFFFSFQLKCLYDIHSIYMCVY